MGTITCRSRNSLHAIAAASAHGEAITDRSADLCWWMRWISATSRRSGVAADRRLAPALDHEARRSPMVTGLPSSTIAELCRALTMVKARPSR
jgi:hypothetical protein